MFKKWKKVISKPLKLIDILITLIVIGITVFLILYWKHIPEQVPQHWNFAGEIDDYSDAGSYIMLVIMMYFFYAGHFLTKLIPEFDLKENLFGPNNADNITKEAEEDSINLIIGMLWICDLIVQAVFAYIILCGIFLRNLGAWFLPLVFILLIVDFIWFPWKLFHLKTKVQSRT